MSYSSTGFAALALGILAGAGLGLGADCWLMALGLTAMGAGWCFFRRHRLWGWWVLAVLCFWGGFYIQWRRQGYLDQRIWNQQFEGDVLTLEGTMVSQPEATMNGSRWVLAIDRASPPEPIGRITVYASESLKVAQSYYGYRMRLTGKFKIGPEIASGFPGFWERNGLTGSLSLRVKPVVLSAGLSVWKIGADRLRRQLMGFGAAGLPDKLHPLLHGMLYGQALPDDWENRRLHRNLQQSGTIHLLSVSGLHVGFIVFGLNLLLARLPLPKAWRLALLAGGVWFYILMTGMRPPIMRAGVMLLIYSLGQLLEAGNDPLNRLSLAGILLLMGNPYYLLDPGFQLSFAATLGVIWLYPLLKPLRTWRVKWLNSIWRGILLSLSAQIMLTPLTVHYFQMIAWGSPLFNLALAVPAQLVVMLGLASELFGILWPTLGFWGLRLVGGLLQFFKVVVQFGSQWTWISGWSPSWPWPWLVGYYLALVILLDRWRPGWWRRFFVARRGQLILVLLIVGNLMIWSRLFGWGQRGYLEVTMIDVGQGDAIFIRTPDGVTALIDAGDEGRGQSRVVPFLRRNGVRRLDAVFGSHGDRDHLGGMDEVLMAIPTRCIFLPDNLDWQVRSVQAIVDLAAEAEIPLERVDARPLRLGRLVEGELFQAPGAESSNDRSLMIFLRFGQNSLLLTGDLEAKGEQILMRRMPGRLRASGLKVGHHGSDNGSTWGFLAQVQPDFALISSGAGNRYGHPSPGVLHRLNSLGVRIFRTDRQGVIRLRLYPRRTLVIPSKGGS